MVTELIFQIFISRFETWSDARPPPEELDRAAERERERERERREKLGTKVWPTDDSRR